MESGSAAVMLYPVSVPMVTSMMRMALSGKSLSAATVELRCSAIVSMTIGLISCLGNACQVWQVESAQTKMEVQLL